MGPKEDQVRALREARYERWRRSAEEPDKVPELGMKKRERIKALEDKVMVVRKRGKKGGRPKILGEPWKLEGISRAQYYRNKGKPK